MLAMLSLSAFADPTIDVEITSSRPVEVSQVQGLQRSPLCTAPCALKLEPGNPTLAFAGAGVAPMTQPLALDAGDRVHLHVKAGSRGASTAGSVLGLAAVGLLVGGTVSFATADSSGPGFAMLGTSLVSGLVALPLVKGGTSKVDVTYE
jgi:hypothetical protein